MSEALASSTEKKTIYVRLLDEGTEVSRPTKALLLAPGMYQLLPTYDYDAEEEHWEFPPGSRVRAEPKLGIDGEFLLAVASVT